MASNNLYKVTYQFGDKTVRQDLVIASAGDAATVAAVLSGNGKSHPSGAVTILSIANAGTALS